MNFRRHFWRLEYPKGYFWGISPSRRKPLSPIRRGDAPGITLVATKITFSTHESIVGEVPPDVVGFVGGTVGTRASQG